MAAVVAAETRHRARPLHTLTANRDFRVIIAGLAVSQSGDWLYNVALAVFIYNRTHSAGWVAAASVLRLAPYVLFSPFGGVIADRFPRRRVMVTCDLLRAALMGGLAAVAAFDGPAALAVAIAFLSTSAGTPYTPAVAAMTPQLVPEQDLAAANAVIETVANVAIVAGPAIGGLLLALGPPALSFGLNGASFLGAALAISLLRARTATTRAGHDALPRKRVLRDLADGLGAVAGSRLSAVIVGLYTGSAIVYGSETVLLVLLSQQQLGTGATGYGYLLAALGAGGILGAMVTHRLAAMPRASVPLSCALFCLGAPLAVLALVHQPVVAFLILVVEGSANITIDVLSITILQRSLPPAMLGRIFGVIMSLGVGAMLLGAIVAPPLVSWLGLRGAVIAMGGLLPVCTVVFAPLMRGAEKLAARRAVTLAPRADALAALAIFESVPRAGLVMLAASLVEETAPSGTDVVREGDPATALFVVRGGDLDVYAAGESGGVPRLVNQLHDGDWFGEIGLLENVPRTATVRTRTDCTLWRIAGADFLDAVNQMPVLSGALLNGMAVRLARTHPSYHSRLLEQSG
jgi:MFS family permease